MAPEPKGRNSFVTYCVTCAQGAALYCTVLYCTVLYCTVLYRVPYSASKFAIRGTMEALYVELRQNHPGNQLHLMLVSPFIVETGRTPDKTSRAVNEPSPC